MIVREDDSPGLHPTSQEVRRQLKALLSSQSFTSAPRLSAFLRYVVERALDGTADGVKEYSIGVEVFDRSDAFDPRTDTIVRVQAGRLRKKLAEYYATDGDENSIVIEVPTGGYVPSFRRRGRINPQANSALTLQADDVGARENGASPSQALLSKEQAKDREERYQHVEELNVDLESRNKKSAIDHASVPMISDSSTARQLQRTWLISGIVLSALLMATVGFIVWQQIRTPPRISQTPLVKFGYPPGIAVASPVISPDGQHIA